MTEQTKNVCLVVEGLAPVTEQNIASITKELGELVARFCGGEIATHVLNAQDNEIQIL